MLDTNSILNDLDNFWLRFLAFVGDLLLILGLIGVGGSLIEACFAGFGARGWFDPQTNALILGGSLWTVIVAFCGKASGKAYTR